MKASIGCLIGFVFVVSVSAEPLLEGRVRLDSGEPVADAQVRLFDLTDLRRGAIAHAMTDGTGYFALPLAALAGSVLPQGFTLGPNYPNPFNPSTIIPYQLVASSEVRLEVFNLLGQHIATLVDGERPAGFHTATWTATDGAGRAVAAGVYLYRMTVGEERQTGRMVLIDGQAGRPTAGSVGSAAAVEAAGAAAAVYGLTVSGPGLVSLVDPAFRVKAGQGPVDFVVAVPGSTPRAKVAATGILGDVDNNAQVDIFDALLVALYSGDASLVLPHHGAIALGDVNADGQVDRADAGLISAYSNDPSDPSLPAGLGKRVSSATASLSPDPSTVSFADDGIWHRFTVQASESVSVVVNPGATSPRLELTTRSGRDNYCPGGADDAVSRENGEAIYLAGCASGTATVELRRASDDTVLQTYTFTVTASPADLVVSASVSASSLPPGQSFTLSATVRNQGTAAAATTLHYYRSSNRTISWQDTQVGSDAVSALAASATSAESISLTAPSDVGTYYYGACVERKSGESAGNNCSAGVRVTVEATSPDLIVESVSVSASSLTTEESFTLNATVRNQGTREAPATALRWYRSFTATISTGDTEVGTDQVDALAAAGTSTESISLTAPSNEGTYYYGACVLSVSNESDTRNNCSSAVTVTVGDDVLSNSPPEPEPPAVSFRIETGVDKAVEALGVSGEGVIVAILDRGIDWESNDFRNSDGSTRIAYIFDFSDDSGAAAPGNPYGLGTIYTEEQINQALFSGTRLPTRDAVGHGTTTTGIAAGNGRNLPDRKYRGVATNATIISVKITGGAPAHGDEPAESDFDSDLFVAIDFVVDKARELSMPVVMLLNIGSITGPTDGTSAFCRKIDETVGPAHPGVVFVTGTGDDGWQTQIRAAGDVPNGGTLDLRFALDTGDGRLEVWYDRNEAFAVSIDTPMEMLGPFPASQSYAEGTGVRVYHDRGDNFFGSTNGKRLLLIDFDSAAGAGDYLLRLDHAASSTGSSIHFDASLNGSGRFLNFVTPGSIWDGATAFHNVAPNSYVIRTKWPTIDGGDSELIGEGNVGELWLGSSVGPTVDGRIGVDISAPGDRIVTTYAPRSHWATYPHLLIEDGGGLYGMAGAVSAAAPVVTGIIALMLEVDPTLDALSVKRTLQETARSDEFTGPTPNPLWGYGKVDAFEALMAVRAQRGP